MAQYVSLATDWWRASSSIWISPTNRVRICSRHLSVYQEVYHSVMNLPYYLRHTLLK